MSNNYHDPTRRNGGRGNWGPKGLLCLAAVLFAMLLPAALHATPLYGSSHFRDASNYDAYSLGSGKIHYKVLVFAEGLLHNYNAGKGGDGSRI